MILAGDIGGTKTNLAYFNVDDDQLTAKLVRSYPNGRFKSLTDLIRAHLQENPAGISAAAFGIAGPVVNGRTRMTNLGWEVDAREVAAQLKLKEVGLMNDLEATAYGTLRLGEEDMLLLNPGSPQRHGTIAVIAAGTGLGEGGLFWDGARYRAIPSEGGHTDFGPRNELEIDLLRFLLQRHDRVSYERVVSGPGMRTLYEFFRSRADYAEPHWLRERLDVGDPSAVVSEVGLEGKDAVCEQALDLFVSLYGAEAGNLALKLLSTGGVFVGGGIAPKILPGIQDGKFLDSFKRKGRYSTLLSGIPVHLILNDKAALLGAAHVALLTND